MLFSVKLAQRAYVPLSRLGRELGERETVMARFIIRGGYCHDR